LGLKEKLKGVVEHEKELWRARDERKKVREGKKMEKLLEEEKRLDAKLERRRIQDRVKEKRRKASPVYGLLKGIGKGLDRVGEEAEGYTAELLSLDAKPKKKRKKPKKKSKKKTKKKKTEKRDPFPKLPPL